MPTKAKAVKEAKTRTTKWQKIFTPKIIIATVLGIFCIIMTLACCLNPGTKAVSVISPVENFNPLSAITPRDRATQQFQSDGDYVRFGLYYANFSNYVQGGKLHIDIKNAHGDSTPFTYDIAGAWDNSFLYVDYPLQKDETYTLTIYLTDGAEGITFFTTTASNFDAKLTVNGKAQDSTIIMAFVTEVKNTFTAWYYVMALALIFCYIVVKIDKDVYA